MRVMGSERSEMEKRMPLLDIVVSKSSNGWEHQQKPMVHNTPPHVYNTDESVTMSTPWWMAPLSVCKRGLSCKWSHW
jgi:hypothetical protein